MPTKVTLKGEAKNPYISIAGASMGLDIPSKSDFERDVTWPMWFGVGFAYKPTDKLTFTLDAQYSQWSEMDELYTDFDNSGWKTLTGAYEDDTFVLDWEDQTQIRFGTEYKIIQNIGLLCGYYYDPAPAPDETLNILFPSSTNHVATIGMNYNYDKFIFEFGTEYLFGAKRDVKDMPENMPGEHKLDVYAWSIGLGYNF